MKITKVWAVYFSPTGNTKKVITTMAKKAAKSFCADGDI
mgnify:CR=1 FL=1